MTALSNSVSIIGCGWLGLPLASFLKEKHFKVKGTTTTEVKLKNLSKQGIDAYLFDVTKPTTEVLSDLVKNVEVMLINVPPGKAGGSNFASIMQQFLTKLKHQFQGKLIFISSTSVFQNAPDFPVYDESSVPNAISGNGKNLADVETFIQTNFQKYCIIRPGGLWSDDRHPVYALYRRSSIANPNAPVNMTQRALLIDVIYQSIIQENFPNIIHAIDPTEETRAEYYARKAQELNIRLPDFEPKTTEGKKIISKLNI